MGIHIHLYRGQGDHPEWDYLRQGNDRNFPQLIDWDCVKYDSELRTFRPTDLQKLEQRVSGTNWEDKGRYLHLVNLLKSDKDCWLYFSY